MRDIHTLYTVVASFLFWTGTWAILSRSPFMQSLLELCTKAPMTRNDVEEYLIEKRRFKLLQLWLCPWCQALWTSVAHAMTLTFLIPHECSPLSVLRIFGNAVIMYPIFLVPTFYFWKK